MNPVSLNELVGEMQTLSDEILGYLNRVTGEIAIIMEEHVRAVENEEDYSKHQQWERDAFKKTKEVLESDDFLELPSHFDIHDYAIMEDFCAAYPDEAMSEDLLDLIRGSGAFRRFKNYINRHGIEQDWYSFEENAYKKIAIEWLEENGIAYTDDMTGK
jgi:hypothetical protein